MRQFKCRKGVSSVLIIIIVLFVVALGGGGYYAYVNYLEPMMNPYSKLIPEGLKPYAMGKDAEAFVIVKNDQELKDTIVSSSPEFAEQVNGFDGAIAVVNTTKLSGAIVILFDSADRAASMKELSESQAQTGAVKFTFEQKDKVLIASFGGGLEAMGGSLLENPAINKLDQTMLDSQLIAYAKISQMGMLGDLISGALPGLTAIESSSSGSIGSIMPSANAQGLTSNGPSGEMQDFSSSPFMTLMKAASLITFIDDTTLYISYKNSVFDIKAEIGFLEKSALAESPLIKNTILKTGNAQISDLEESYDDVFTSVQLLTAGLQTLLDEQTKANPGSEAKIFYSDSDRKLSLTVSFAKEIAEKQVQSLALGQLSAPAKARDAARRADIYKIEAVVESYNTDKGEYPKASMCMEEMEDDFKSFFNNEKLPLDPSGSQDFGTMTCQNGYYYQSLGDDDYAIWAKMEDPENGNTMLIPEELAEQVTSEGFTSGETGSYSVIVSASNVAASSTLKFRPLEADEIPESFLFDDFVVTARPQGGPEEVEFILEVAPGGTAQASVIVLNYSKERGTASIYATDGRGEKLGGIKDEDELNYEVGLWTKVNETEVTLDPREEEIVDFTVDVPKNTKAGTYEGNLVIAYQGKGSTKMALTITVNVIARPAMGVKRVQ